MTPILANKNRWGNIRNLKTQSRDIKANTLDEIVCRGQREIQNSGLLDSCNIISCIVTLRIRPPPYRLLLSLVIMIKLVTRFQTSTSSRLTKHVILMDESESQHWSLRGTVVWSLDRRWHWPAVVWVPELFKTTRWRVDTTAAPSSHKISMLNWTRARHSVSDKMSLTGELGSEKEGTAKICEVLSVQPDLDRSPPSDRRQDFLRSN